jgi:hypothetical protein
MRFIRLSVLASSHVIAQKGYWNPSGSSGTLALMTGAVCIHTAILPNNKLLCFERPHKDQYQLNAQTSGMLSSEIDLMATVNSDGTVTSV